MSEQKITLNENQKSVKQILQSITNQTGIKFSYNSQIINDAKITSIKISNANISNVLKLLFKDTISFKQVSNYIILSKSNTQKKENEFIVQNQNQNLPQEENQIIQQKENYRIFQKDKTIEIQNIESNIFVPTKKIEYQDIGNFDIDCQHYITNNNDSMKKYLTTLLVTSALMTNTALAQENTISYPKNSWTIGVATGLRGEVCYTSELYRTFWTGNKISIPSIELNVAYCLADNFSIESGLSYIRNRANYAFATSPEEGIDKIQAKPFFIYSALQIPLAIKYHLPLGKSGFSFFPKVGVAFSFTLGSNITNRDPWSDSYTIEYMEEEESTPIKTEIIYYYTSYGGPYRDFNLLLNAGLGFAYKFDFGLAISVYGEYYYGVRKMARIRMDFNIDEKYTQPEHITFNGDYWNAGLGISYTFKNKKKE